jgi:large subunit ribosomal protein L10
MDRAEKSAFVQDMHSVFADTGCVVVAHYSGLTVAEMGDLRRRMRTLGATFRVTKNRLTQLALRDTPYASLSDLLKGPTGLAFSSDPVAAAKASVEFAKQNQKLVVLGGAIGGTMLDAKGVEALASLPSLDELRAKLIGLVNAPASKLVGVLQAPAGQLARVLQAYASKEAA